MIGVWLAGGVYVPVNPRLSEHELAEVLHTTAPAAVITPAGVERRTGASPYAEDVAFVMWTSGTTGVPKAIHHTHTAYLELLDRVSGPAPRRRSWFQASVSQPHPGVDGPQRRALQRGRSAFGPAPPS